MPKGIIGQAIHAQMLTRSHDISSMFADASSVDRHQRHVANLIQCAVDNLTDIENALKPWLDLIGKGHSGFSTRLALFII